MNQSLHKQLSLARDATPLLRKLSATKKNRVLVRVAQLLWRERAKLLLANAMDCKKVPSNYPLMDRLKLSENRIRSMAESIAAVTKLPDPIGEVLERYKRPSGLRIERVRVPLGVIGVIYEARPNVTTEVFSLTFKTGNAVVLKGGRDAVQSNCVIVNTIQRVLRAEGIPITSVINVDPTDRRIVDQLVQAHGLVDVVIPRGSEQLITYVREHATVPVIETGAGVCHTFVERTATIPLAVSVINNAKTQRYTVCNALDCLVVEKAIAPRLFRSLAPVLAMHPVELRADPESYRILKSLYPKPLLKKVRTTDFGKEFLSLRLAIKIVRDPREAFDFIQRHTSHHSEAILTGRSDIARRFVQSIDAAVVYINTSTAFTDGFEFGLGAEVGISTQKLHARGPMGLHALTTYAWIVTSHGAIRKH